MVGYMAKAYFKKVTDCKIGSYLEPNIHQVLIYQSQGNEHNWDTFQWINSASATFDTKKIDTQRLCTNIHLKQLTWRNAWAFPFTFSY